MKERIETLAQTVGVQPFLIDARDGSTLNYLTFLNQAFLLGKSIREKGIKRGDRVAIVLPNSKEFVLFYFACFFEGFVAVPINIKFHPREIAHILNHSKPKAIAYSPETQALLPALDSPEILVVLVDDIFRKNLTVAPPAAKLWTEIKTRNEDLFTIHYTSGTTGLPKGVMHSVGSLTTAASNFNEALGYHFPLRMLHVLPMGYMAGFLNTILCPFLNGGTIILGRSFDAEMSLRFWEIVRRYSVNRLWLTPTIVAAIMRTDRGSHTADYCVKNIRSICVGTAPLSRSLKAEFEKKYRVPLLESYGITEVLFIAANGPPHSQKENSAGRLLRDVEVRFQEGELWVRSKHMMAGYFGGESPFKEGWYPSGDLGHLDSEGFLFVTGRKKDLIIHGGTNVSPTLVENAIQQYAGTLEAAAVGLPHPFYVEEVVVAVVLRPGFEPGAAIRELNVICQNQLDAESRPTQYFFLEALPRNPTGKVQKNVLRDQLALQSAKLAS